VNDDGIGFSVKHRLDGGGDIFQTFHRTDADAVIHRHDEQSVGMPVQAPQSRFLPEHA